jgi:hypothetical protein
MHILCQKLRAVIDLQEFYAFNTRVDRIFESFRLSIIEFTKCNPIYWNNDGRTCLNPRIYGPAGMMSQYDMVSIPITELVSVAENVLTTRWGTGKRQPVKGTV